MDRKWLKETLAKHEGYREQVYDDATGRPIGPGDTLIGHPTIGYGRALDVNGLSRKEIEYLFENDIVQCVFQLCGQDWFNDLTPVRQEAMVLMCYQMGIGNVKKFKKMICAFYAGDYNLAAMEALNSRWARNHKHRANQVAEMIRTGEKNGDS
jgi:lysozyme